MNNRDIYLVVHKSSYCYITDTCAYIRATLAELCAAPVKLVITDRVDAVGYAAKSIVWIIGDPFPRYQRQADCFYVFLNFSLLCNVTKRWWLGRSDRLWFEDKKRIFLQKLSNYDLVGDFYEPQSQMLKEEIESSRGIRVVPFLTNVQPSPDVQLATVEQCKWDVCIVGSISPRRLRAYRRLEELGCQLSPVEGDLAHAIANSKLTLNIHMHNCDHLEAPRIIQVLKMGRCLVTENCHHLDQMIPLSCYCMDRYANLVKRVSELLADPQRVAKIGDTAKLYMETNYEKKCEESWRQIVNYLPVLFPHQVPEESDKQTRH